MKKAIYYITVLTAMILSAIACTEKEEPAPTVESIEFTNVTANLEMNIGESIKISYKIRPEALSQEKVTWKSSNEKVIKVMNGFVTAVGPGEAVVTATCGEVSTSIKIKTKVIAVENLSFDKNEVQMVKGMDININVKEITPAEGSLASVGFMIEDASGHASDICTISEIKLNSIYVHAEKAGTCYLAAHALSGDAKCKINVLEKEPAVDFSIPTELEIELSEGTGRLDVTDIQPATSDATAISWSVEDDNILQISSIHSDHLVLTPLKQGRTIVTGECSGGMTRNCAVLVKNGPLRTFETKRTWYDIKVGDYGKIQLIQEPKLTYNQDQIEIEYLNGSEKVIRVEYSGQNQSGALIYTVHGLRVGDGKFKFKTGDAFGYETTESVSVVSNKKAFDPKFDAEAVEKGGYIEVHIPGWSSNVSFTTSGLGSGKFMVAGQNPTKETWTLRAPEIEGLARLKVWVDDGDPIHTKTFEIPVVSERTQAAFFYYKWNSGTPVATPLNQANALTCLPGKEKCLKIGFPDYGYAELPKSLLDKMTFRYEVSCMPESGEKPLVTFQKNQEFTLGDNYHVACTPNTVYIWNGEKCKIIGSYPNAGSIEVTGYLDLHPYLALYKWKGNNFITSIKAPKKYNYGDRMDAELHMKHDYVFLLQTKNEILEKISFNDTESHMTLPLSSYFIKESKDFKTYPSEDWDRYKNHVFTTSNNAKVHEVEFLNSFTFNGIESNIVFHYSFLLNYNLMK